MNLTDRKIDLILKMYVDPADEDYIAARSAYSNGLFHVFYWCAAQCCEKYLKAILLLQGQHAQGYGHDLVTLFQDARRNDQSNIVPELLDIPKTTAMGHENWHGKHTSLYIDYLAIYGAPDNRYAFEGTYVNGPVMHALDILCRAFRRLMREVNLTGGDLFAHQNSSLMTHDQLCDSQDWMIDPARLLERLFVERYQVGQDRELRNAFSNMNLAFFQTRTENERSFGGQHFHGSPLYNHLVRLAKIETSPMNLEIVEQLRAWASDNIHMHSEVRRQLDLPRAPRRS